MYVFHAFASPASLGSSSSSLRRTGAAFGSSTCGGLPRIRSSTQKSNPYTSETHRSIPYKQFGETAACEWPTEAEERHGCSNCEGGPRRLGFRALGSVKRSTGRGLGALLPKMPSCSNTARLPKLPACTLLSLAKIDPLTGLASCST